MTPKQFTRECVRYFGDWPMDKPGVREAVVAYVATKTPGFLAALWPLVRDSRPQGYGPPDMAALMENAGVAAEHALTHTSRLMLEDQEPRASMDEVRAALGAIEGQLAEKAEAQRKAREAKEEPRRPRAFDYLDDVIWNARVSLAPEFYDETISMAERMESYAARYHGKARR